jgi:hypothetical protein
MPGVSRSQLAVRVGNRLQEIAGELRELPDDRQFRLAKLANADLALSPLTDDLVVLVRSCKEARGMYLSYPRLRQAIMDGGEIVEGIQKTVISAKGRLHNRMLMDPSVSFDDLRKELLLAGTRLKMVTFNAPRFERGVPPEPESEGE